MRRFTMIKDILLANSLLVATRRSGQERIGAIGDVEEVLDLYKGVGETLQDKTSEKLEELQQTIEDEGLVRELDSIRKKGGQDAGDE